MGDRKARRATRRALRASGVMADYGTLPGWFRTLRCRLTGHQAIWEMVLSEDEDFAGHCELWWSCSRCPVVGSLGCMDCD